VETPGERKVPDPRYSLFWTFISFIGISIPRQGQEKKALRMLIIGTILLLAFIAAGMLAVMRLW